MQTFNRVLQKNRQSIILRHIPTPMELKMFLGNDYLDSMPLDFTKVSIPGYLGALKRQLEKKYAELIASSGTKPEYFVDNSVRVMNLRKTG